jgi:hypothetical protein
MTAGALPVGAIAGLTMIPKTRKAMKQVATMTLREGNRNAVIKILWLRNWKTYCQRAKGGPTATSVDLTPSRLGSENRKKCLQHRPVQSRHLPEGKR